MLPVRRAQSSLLFKVIMSNSLEGTINKKIHLESL